MNKIVSAFLISCVLGSSVLPCFAQNFTKKGQKRNNNVNFGGGRFIDTGPSALGSSFKDFNKSLDNTASRMRRDHDRSENAAAHRNLVNAQANQADTGLQLQRSFNNTQRQAVESGGLYNQPGGFVAPAAYGNGIYRRYRNNY